MSNPLDLLYPKSCIGCKRSGYYLCPTCVNKVPFAQKKCIYCGRASIDGFTHVKCRRKYRIDGSISIFKHDGIVRSGIIKLKYKFIYEMGTELANYVSIYLRKSISAIPKEAVLVPIPLHPKREKWRGFNQAEKLGKIVAIKMGWKYVPNLLIRTKLTTPQVNLKGDERRKNLKGVFDVNSRYVINGMKYVIPIVLFDDVITTGATVMEAGKVLKHAGFNTVWGLSVAG